MQDKEVAKVIGENVKKYRRERKYTQKRLAKEVGLADHSAISKLETGKFLPSVTLLLAISRALNIEFTCLFIGVRTL